MIGDHRLPAPAGPARGRALLRVDRPGLQLQGRPSRLAPRPRQRQEDPRRQVRHQGLPRSAEGRRHAADHPRSAASRNAPAPKPDSVVRTASASCRAPLKDATSMDRRQFSDHLPRSPPRDRHSSRSPPRPPPRPPAPAASGDAKLNALFEEIFQDRVKRQSGASRRRWVSTRAPIAPSQVGARRPPLSAGAQGRPRARQARASRASRPSRRPACRTPPSSTATSSSTRSRPASSRRRVQHRSASSAPIRSSSRAAPTSRRPTSSTPPTRSRMRRTPRPIFRACALVGKSLDNDTDDQRAQAARGFLAPAWSIDLTLGQMRKLREPAPDSQHDGQFHRPPDEGQGHRRRLAGPRRARSSPTASIRRSTARSR